MPNVNGKYYGYDDEITCIITNSFNNNPMVKMIARGNEYSYEHPVF